ncbi:MAG: response regulator [Bacteroidetes bacterium]|nr:response regulator [Bacteroidota bacterium]
MSTQSYMHTLQAAADATDAVEFLKKKSFGILLVKSKSNSPIVTELLQELIQLKKLLPLLIVGETPSGFITQKAKYKAPILVIDSVKLTKSEFYTALLELSATKSKLDVTAKELARINENRYRVLFENTQGFICTHKMDGEIISINRAAAKILGFKAHELIGRNLHEFLVEEKKDMFVDYLQELKEKQKSTGIMQFMSKDNEKRYLVYRNVVHTEADSEPYVIASSQDITDIFLIEKQLESANRISELNINRLHKTLLELDKAKKIAEESVRIKQEFLANMSHEIRTPMNAIIGFASLLEKSNLNNEQSDYLSAIKTSGDNLLVIINDILDFSKIDAGMMSIENTQFDIDIAINNVINQFQPKIQEKNLLLKTSFNFKRNLNLIGDQVRLHQVLSNLISNAIKFTDKGGITISVNQKKETSKFLILEFIVSDTGIGIPNDKTETIFESFTQASPETTRKYGGTGLGLAIVKKLLELQNGAIHLKSHLNVGTTFTFTIPYLKTNLSDLSNKKEKLTTVQSLSGLTVLVAEDNLLNQKLVVKLLEDLNCVVDVAQNGFEAVDKVKSDKYDLVFMDIQMPEMDGLQATKIIRTQLQNNVPIIALTAHTFKDEEDKCRESGMNDFLSKPFTVNALYKIITSTIDKGLLKRLTGTKVINLDFLTNLADGNTDFVIKMLEIYLKQTPENLVELEHQLSLKNYTGLVSIAHKMRSSVPYVGLTEAEKLLEKIEYEAKQNINVEDFPQLVNRIIKLCEDSLVQVKEQLYLLGEKSIK